MKPAKLPRSMMERRVKDLDPGERCWVVPWAMLVTDDRDCYVDGDYAVHYRPEGTANMELEIDHSGALHVQVPPRAMFAPMGLAGRNSLIPVASIKQQREGPQVS